jgi:membrane protease YdiL (CAAX protease family)
MQPFAEENSLTAPHNPLEGQAETLPSQASAVGTQPADLPPIELLAPPYPLAPSSPPAENPPWSGLDVLILAAVTIFAIFLSMMGVSLVAHMYFEPGVPWVDVARKPEVVVLSQVLGYLVVLALMVRLASAHGDSAASALKWNWPQSWPAFLGYGVVLSIALQLLAHLLPMPKTLPIDEFFQTPREAWLLSLFGITFAPLLEELFFRGFLYPVLARRFSVATGILVTGLAFGAIHGAQLKYSWGPVLVIVLVGIVLTTVRAASKSVASTFLMHVGYNFTLMVAMFAGTDGFRHLEKLRT